MSGPRYPLHPFSATSVAMKSTPASTDPPPPIRRSAPCQSDSALTHRRSSDLQEQRQRWITVSTQYRLLPVRLMPICRLLDEPNPAPVGNANQQDDKHEASVLVAHKDYVG